MKEVLDFGDIIGSLDLVLSVRLQEKISEILSGFEFMNDVEFFIFDIFGIIIRNGDFGVEKVVDLDVYVGEKIYLIDFIGVVLKEVLFLVIVVNFDKFEDIFGENCNVLEVVFLMLLDLFVKVSIVNEIQEMEEISFEED